MIRWNLSAPSELEMIPSSYRQTEGEDTEIRPAQPQSRRWHQAPQVAGSARGSKLKSPKSPLLSLLERVSPLGRCMQGMPSVLCTSSSVFCTPHGVSLHRPGGGARGFLCPLPSPALCHTLCHPQ